MLYQNLCKPQIIGGCSCSWAPAVPAGFLDKVLPAAELKNEAQKLAATITKLSIDVLAASKLRLRDQTLKAVRAAIDSDRGLSAPA
jgi:hypothetical protein